MSTAESIEALYDEHFTKTGNPVAAATLVLASVLADTTTSPVNKSRQPSEILNPPEVAEMLRVSPETVHGWIRSRQLKAANVAGPGSRRPRWKVKREDLDAFLARRRPGSRLGGRSRAHRRSDPKPFRRYSDDNGAATQGD